MTFNLVILNMPYGKFVLKSFLERKETFFLNRMNKEIRQVNWNEEEYHFLLTSFIKDEK